MPKTHRPATVLTEMLAQGQIPDELHRGVEQLISLAVPLGPELHIQTDYGYEVGGLTPWELFDEDDARETLRASEDVVSTALEIIGRTTP